MSQYVAKNLQYNENIIFKPRLHWSIYLDKYFKISLIFAIFCLIMNVYAYQIWFFREFFWHSESFIGAVAGLRILYVWIKSYSTEMLVTSSRVIYKTGFFNIRMEQLENNRIESIEVQQSFSGNFLNYGDIIFSGTGTSKLTFERVFAPWQVKEMVEDVLYQQQNKHFL